MRRAAFPIIILLLSACNVLPQMPTPTPTHRFTAPTLAPSPEVVIRNSDDLYGEPGTSGQSNPTAAALPVGAALPPVQSGSVLDGSAQAVQIVLNDGSLVTGLRYEVEGQRRPGVLILAQDTLAWRGLADALFAASYTVLIVELPSIPRAETLVGLLDSFSEDGGLDPARIAVIGAQETADMALLGCAVDERCDAVVLLSPQGRDALLNVLPNFNPRPMLVVAARSDESAAFTAQSLSERYAEGSQSIALATGQGAGMLALNSTLPPAIINWLNGIFGV